MTTERPRLLVVTSTYPRWRDDPEPGFVHELSRRLTGTFDVTVVGPHAPGSRRREIIDGVNVVRFRYAPSALEQLAFNGGILANLQRKPWTWLLVPLFVASQVWSAARELRRHRYDAIHAHWLVPQGIVASLARFLSGRKVPILCTSHGADLYALRGWPGRTLKRAALRACNALTVVSSPMREEAARFAKLPPADVIPMGVDLSHTFVPGEDSRNENALLFAGRLVEKKGVSTLVKAFRAVLEDVPEAELWVVGEGPERASLERMAADLGVADRVRFHGSVRHAQLPEFFRKAAVVVMPSLEARSGDQEGFGLVLVEAMGCGAPVIASNYPAIHDIVEGDMVKLVDAGDEVQLAEACRALLKDAEKRKRMSTAGRAHVASRFDWSVTVSRYAEALSRMIAR